MCNIIHGYQCETEKEQKQNEEKWPYLTTFDAVEEFWMWIPLQSHGTDYALEENV